MTELNIHRTFAPSPRPSKPHGPSLWSSPLEEAAPELRSNRLSMPGNTKLVPTSPWSHPTRALQPAR